MIHLRLKLPGMCVEFGEEVKAMKQVFINESSVQGRGQEVEGAAPGRRCSGCLSLMATGSVEGGSWGRPPGRKTLGECGIREEKRPLLQRQEKQLPQRTATFLLGQERCKGKSQKRV